MVAALGFFDAEPLGVRSPVLLTRSAQGSSVGEDFRQDARSVPDLAAAGRESDR